MTAPLISRARFTLLLACFFLSGSAGLVYQVAWGKALGLIFGNTVYAISTVLAVFMGGLAIGSAWWGRMSERRANPVLLYGWMELGVATTGAVSLAGLAAVRRIYLAAHPLVAGSGPALLLLRFLGAAIVLFLPTFLMGGTLPVLVQGLTRHSAELGRRLSRLYWINTGGAVAGTLAAGFFLLANVGLRATVETAVGVNLVAGVLAVALGRGFGVPPAATSTGAHPPRVSQPLSRFLLAAFAVVGATAIAYEVAWTRLLVTFFGSSTYAFTLMLATFLAGIVLGSLLFEWWVARGGVPSLGGFALTQILTALAALGFLIFYRELPAIVVAVLNWPYDRLPEWLTGPLGLHTESFTALALAQFATAAAAMLPAATIFGFNFPLATVVIARRPGVERDSGAAVGKAYAANTLGAIAGAVLSGFFLIPRVGAFRVVGVMALANVLVALALLASAEGLKLVPLVGTLALGGAIAAAMASGRLNNPAIATFAPFLYYDPSKTRLTIQEWAESFDVLYARDGLNASVSVAAGEDYIALRTNGKVDASNRDIETQLFSGHLGAMFHPSPRRVLVVGFGSGMTVAALARYPEVKQIDCVEIEPGIIEAAPLLDQLNRGVLRDPRVHVVLDDARNFLLTTRETYDLIVSEPSNPWIAGVASLFTDEYYQVARSRLRPGGLMVQWIQGYSIFPDDLRMVLATVAGQFESVSVWRGEEPDFLLLARMDRTPMKLDRLGELLQKPAIRADFEAVNVFAPEGVLAYHRLDDQDLRRFVAGVRHNTDDNTLLEFHAPRALLRHGLYEENIEEAWKARSSPLPNDVRVSNPREALLAAADTALWNDDWPRARTFLDAVRDSGPSAFLELLRGRLDFGTEDYASAGEHYSAALHLDPSLTDAARGLAEVARHNDDLDAAYLLYRQIVGREPKNLPALAGLVKVLDRKHEPGEAAVWLATKLKSDSDPDPSEFALLGDFFVQTGHRKEAVNEYQEAIHRDAYSYAGHRGLGDLYRAEGQWHMARENYEFAARFDPESSAEVFAGLVDAYRHLGRERDARQALEKGLRLFPGDATLNALSSSH
ncbi:MAG TPA: fused MFS/spermidine synthase [Candidatus Acidoferrales bacterium]|nr:fused MFS/spermidine synthase [Candidatus Acidoferrales bacterium]